MPATYKRRVYFIDKKFQANFILKFCALVAVGGLLSIGILYLLAMQSTTVSIVNSRVVVKTTADFILPILVQTVIIVMVIVSIATIFVTLFVSHKIAGPLYRFKKTMKELEAGNFAEDFRIRHLDQLRDLAETFNSMIRKIREEALILKGSFKNLEEKLNNISENDMPQDRRAAFHELKDILGDLNTIIKYFRT